MKNNMKKEYIDANIFIQAIIRNDPNCIKVLEKIINKDFISLTSILSWDELTYIIDKFIDREIAVMEGEKYLQFPNLNFIDAKKEIIIKAQNLLKKYNIKPRDAIHAATALHSGATEIISEDSDFDKIIEIKRIDPQDI